MQHTTKAYFNLTNTKRVATIADDGRLEASTNGGVLVNEYKIP